MNILMILSNPFTNDPRVYNESCSLVRGGHSVNVLTWDVKKENSPKDVKDGINIIRSYNTKLMDKVNKKTKICFVGSLTSSFIRKDCEILKKHFNVDIVQPPKIKSGLFKWMKYIFKLLKKVKQSDVTFSWFAGWHSAFAVFFSKLFRKKSIVVVGGYDVAYVPEINYGAFTNLKEMLPAKFVYNVVNKALVVDISLKNDIIKNAKVSGDNIEYVPTGYNSDYWKPRGKKENVVLTVAGARNIQRIKIKGLETFVRSASYIKNVKFIVIGVSSDAKSYLENIIPKNVELIEFLPHKKLVQYYQLAKVYCQLSLREGLPNTLCEAMLCECIPVGTERNGIPTAIGNTGFYVTYGDEKATAEAIKKAIDVPDKLRKKVRERIMKRFSLVSRENKLRNIINDMKK